MFESTVPLCSRPTVGVLCLSSAVLVLICARISLRSIANDANRGRFRSTIRSRCDGRESARFSTSARVERPFRRRCGRCRCCDAVTVVLDWLGCESTLSIFGFSDSRCFLCRLGIGVALELDWKRVWRCRRLEKVVDHFLKCAGLAFSTSILLTFLEGQVLRGNSR